MLLIATQLLFQSITQTMIKASGKFVSILLGFLQKHLNEQDFSVLQNYHGILLNNFLIVYLWLFAIQKLLFVLDLVVLLLKTEDSNEKENIKSTLKEATRGVKELASNFKKI